MRDAKEIYVRDLLDTDLDHSLIVNEDELLEDVLKKYSYHKQHLGIFVVRDKNIFLGMVRIADILSFISLKMGEASYRESAWDILRISKSCTVKDIITEGGESAYVKPEDNVHEALRLMRERNLIDLPVINEKRQIVGHLNLPEMLRQILEKMPPSKACIDDFNAKDEKSY